VKSENCKAQSENWKTASRSIFPQNRRLDNRLTDSSGSVEAMIWMAAMMSDDENSNRAAGKSIVDAVREAVQNVRRTSFRTTA
jgi:hypothetical protein